MIGLEAKAVLDELGITPDIVIGCHGGGSNFGGIIVPFMEEKIAGQEEDRVRRLRAARLPVAQQGPLRV